MKAYLTVGEMGRMFGLNVQTLHYYDKIGLFCPQLRNPETGRAGISLTRSISWPPSATCANWAIRWRMSGSTSIPAPPCIPWICCGSAQRRCVPSGRN